MKDTGMVNIINKEITYKEICNAIECSEEATKVITVDAGKFGSILLSVCAKCAKKFVPT